MNATRAALRTRAHEPASQQLYGHSPASRRTVEAEHLTNCEAFELLADRVAHWLRAGIRHSRGTRFMIFLVDRRAL